jgi:hypothetical protein
MGLVYVLIELPAAEFVKIGWTGSKSATERLNSCQTGNPRRLAIFATRDAEIKAAELNIQRALFHYHARGEWFYFGHDAWEELQALGFIRHPRTEHILLPEKMAYLKRALATENTGTTLLG